MRHGAVPFTDFNEAGRPTGFNSAFWKEVAATLRAPCVCGISRASVFGELRRNTDLALINNMHDGAWRSNLEGALGAGAVSPN